VRYACAIRLVLILEKVLKASKALLKHIKSSAKESEAQAAKKSLLAGGDEEEDDDEVNETPIWLTLTTKKHIVDQKRLKPGKVALPHPLNTSETASICLITADPQRAYKDIIASPAFPAELRARIGRVIGVKKIKAKYSQYEAQRQLLAEHEIFLADDRIITQLPKLLGKTFFKSTTKRPFPISMQAPAPRSEGKRITRAKGDGVSKELIEPKKLAAEIEKTFKTALVALSPSTQTSVRVALAGWSAEDVAENIEAVANELITKYVPQKWRGVRALHVKSPNSAALPIWLADELWTDSADVLENAPETVGAATEAEEANVGKKRKRKPEEEVHVEAKKDKKAKKALPESNDGSLDKEIALRKEKLKKQKAEAEASVKEEVPVPAATAKATKSKKRKASD
jgi:ribosome biogenesis protein UTP30